MRVQAPISPRVCHWVPPACGHPGAKGQVPNPVTIFIHKARTSQSQGRERFLKKCVYSRAFANDSGWTGRSPQQVPLSCFPWADHHCTASPQPSAVIAPVHMQESPGGGDLSQAGGAWVPSKDSNPGRPGTSGPSHPYRARPAVKVGAEERAVCGGPSEEGRLRTRGRRITKQ